jgi:hydrogenase maturation protease
MTPGAAPRGGLLVVGLGSPDQGDDTVGPAVAEVVAGERMPGVTVAIHEDPTSLMHLWHDIDATLVVDAVLSGKPAGTLTVLEVGAGEPALAPETWAETGRGGTHAFGLATAVELARTLGRLPRRVTLVGIEAATFEQGSVRSAAVETAIADAVDVVRRVANEHLAGAV